MSAFFLVLDICQELTKHEGSWITGATTLCPEESVVLMYVLDGREVVVIGTGVYEEGHAVKVTRAATLVDDDELELELFPGTIFVAVDDAVSVLEAVPTVPVAPEEAVFE